MIKISNTNAEETVKRLRMFADTLDNTRPITTKVFNLRRRTLNLATHIERRLMSARNNKAK